MKAEKEVINSDLEEMLRIVKDEADHEKEKERILNEWRKSLSNFAYKPEDFKFKFTDL
jgi:hypothetical protein